MGGFFKALRAGIRAAQEGMGPGRFTAAGLPVACTHCKNDVFSAREAQLHSTGATFLNLEWLGPTVSVLICMRCGLAQWFALAPERVPD